MLYTGFKRESSAVKCDKDVQWSTCRVRSVCNPQRSWVCVDAVGDHSVVNGSSRRNLIAGQQAHDSWVPVVELMENKQSPRRRDTDVDWDGRVCPTHRQHGVEQMSDEGRAALDRVLRLRQVRYRVSYVTGTSVKTGSEATKIQTGDRFSHHIFSCFFLVKHFTLVILHILILPYAF